MTSALAHNGPVLFLEHKLLTKNWLDGAWRERAPRARRRGGPWFEGNLVHTRA